MPLISQVEPCRLQPDEEAQPTRVPEPKQRTSRRSQDQDLLPVVNADDYSDQVPRGACAAMIDWFGFRLNLVDTSTGESIPPKAFLARQYSKHKSLPPADQRVRCVKNRYYIDITETCSLHVYAYLDCLVVGGNPNHVVRTWNEFSVATPDASIQKFQHAVEVALRELHGPNLGFYDCRVTRIDITQVFHCPSSDAAHNSHCHLRMHLRGVNSRDRLRSYIVRENTIMIGDPDDGFQFRIYRMCDKRDPLLLPEEDCEIRIELVLRPKGIIRLLKAGRWTPNDLNGVFEHFLPNLREVYHQYRPARTKHPPRGLSRELVPAWSVWILGIDLRTIPEYTENYAKLCTNFLRHGIDITEAPSPRAEYSSSALSLTELLDPSRYNADGHQCPGLVDRLAAHDHKLHTRRSGKVDHG